MEELTANLKKEKISLQDSKITLYEHLIKPDIRIKTLIPENKYSEEVMRGTEIEIKYSPYVKQMLAEIKELRNLERVKIPEGIDYNAISGLSLEIKEKLSSFKPINLGQASRISGITPAAVSILLVYLKKFRLT
jgi:tRNA uridine 5-carboxymethylaminomethyl modification enzyme